MNKELYIPYERVAEFMEAAFMALGVPEGEAAICADVLIESDKRGIESHGINRFKPFYVDRINNGVQFAKTAFEVVRESPTTAVIDAHHGMGMVASEKAMRMAIEKARTYGMGMTVVRNSTHYGIAGYYATMATDEGMIGITGTNARPSIAPTFAVENMLGTNPLVFGFPTDEEFPFVLDCATSITQRGKIEKAARAGKSTPPGTVIGHDGAALTDSEAILQGLLSGKAALTPLGGIGEDLGGYKGYGYATVVEILSAALQSGSYLHMLSGIDAEGKLRPHCLGHFFIAINPENFMGEAEFRKTTGNILRGLRAAKKAPGAERIYTAGEKEYLHYLATKDRGVKFDESLRKEFLAVKEMLGLDLLPELD